jgi:hypothetical protein
MSFAHLLRRALWLACAATILVVPRAGASATDATEVIRNARPLLRIASTDLDRDHRPDLVATGGGHIANGDPADSLERLPESPDPQASLLSRDVPPAAPACVLARATRRDRSLASGAALAPTGPRPPPVFPI